MYVEVQELSPEAERRYRETRGEAVPVARPRARAARARVLAEGDSWFDYLPAYLDDPRRGDLLGHLHDMDRYELRRVARAGDTLENMVYGTDYRERDWSPLAPQLEATLAELRRMQPQVFLFSGAGNDLAGDELASFLNHRDSGLPPLREAQLDAYIRDALIPSFETLIRRVKEISPRTLIFIHGYDYAIPDGRAVIRIVPGWSYIGPWLRPAFVRKRILDPGTMRDIVRTLINRLNDAIADVAARHADVHHLDCRTIVGDGEWANELHPTSRGFGQVARLFDEKIQAALAVG